VRSDARCLAWTRSIALRARCRSAHWARSCGSGPRAPHRIGDAVGVSVLLDLGGGLAPSSPANDVSIRNLHRSALLLLQSYGRTIRSYDSATSWSRVRQGRSHRRRSQRTQPLPTVAAHLRSSGSDRHPLYEDALIPVALAHSFAAYPLTQAQHVLRLFTEETLGSGTSGAPRLSATRNDARASKVPECLVHGLVMPSRGWMRVVWRA
jgi:hypothetical protein